MVISVVLNFPGKKREEFRIYRILLKAERGEFWK